MLANAQFVPHHSYMPQSFDSLRISQPNIIYDQLEDSHNPSARFALQALGEHFSLNLPSAPYGLGGAWEKVSDAMLADPSAIELPGKRPWLDNAKRVLTLVQIYPWLRGVDSSQPDTPMSSVISDTEFFGIFLGHSADDYPGLFGLTVIEAKQLRAMSQDTHTPQAALAEQIGLHDI